MVMIWNQLLFSFKTYINIFRTYVFLKISMKSPIGTEPLKIIFDKTKKT